MSPRKFFGATSREVLATVRQALGDDALIVSNRPVNGGSEITALPRDIVLFFLQLVLLLHDVALLVANVLALVLDALLRLAKIACSLFGLALLARARERERGAFEIVLFGLLIVGLGFAAGLTVVAAATLRRFLILSSRPIAAV